MEHTMNDVLMAELLSTSESRVCDFKIQIYDMQEEASRVSFLKDILSIANTIRDEIGYIIVGVKQDNGHVVFQDVDTDIDENVFLTFIKGNIVPEWPMFSYYTYSYKKHMLGIFEIGIAKSGPYYSKKDFGDKVKKDVIYYRYGSSNTEANNRMANEILCWMRNASNDEYDIFLEDVELFDTAKYNYVLFMGNDGELNTNQYKMLGKIPWSAVIDMRYGSESSGFYKYSSPTLNSKISVHLITANDERVQKFYDGKTLLWYWAGGEKEADGKLYSVREWRKIYAPNIIKVLDAIMNSSNKKIIFLSLLPKADMSNVIENFIGLGENKNLFGKYVEFKWECQFSRKEELGYINVQGTIAGMCSVFNSIDSSKDFITTDVLVPSRDGKLSRLSQVSWLREELEPVYNGIEYDDSEKNDDISRKSFFKGEMIRWNEMSPCITVTRKKFEIIKKQLDDQLTQEGMRTRIVRLDYQAGAGATTVARMLGWFFHETYPVIIIRKYSESTAERLKSIYADTGKAKMLLLIDEVDIYDTFVEDLRNRLCVEQIQAVILHVKRYLSSDSRVRNNDNILFERLDRVENKEFHDIYNRQLSVMGLPGYELDKRSKRLLNLSNGEKAYRTPFLYALTAFEEDFIRLDSYVASHLSQINGYQTGVFQTISVIQYFTGLSVPLFVLEDDMRSETGRFSLENMLQKEQKTLLLITLQDVRVVHHCLAKAILEHICGLNLVDKRSWKKQLKDVLLVVIKKLKRNANHELVKVIIQKLFLQQTDSTNKTTHFADAVEYLQDNEKREVFKCLKEEYPQNEYVYSNTARFYLFVVKDYEKALIEIDSALNIREDYTFFHIKGMILARKFIKYVVDNSDTIRKNYPIFIQELRNEKELIFQAYDKSIEMKYDNMFAYNGKFIFCMDFLKCFMRHVYPEINIDDFIKKEQNYWYMDLIDDAQGIIEELKALQEHMGIDLEEQIESYKSQLAAARGDTSLAIETWNNLLTRPKVYYPPIRRVLVSTYELQCKGQWEKLGEKKCAHIEEILERNIAEVRDDPRNILQWFQFARCFPGNLEKSVSYFSIEPVHPSLQYYFYGMVVMYAYIIKVKDYSILKLAKLYEKKCENLARDYSNRHGVKEFYNPMQDDIMSIVSIGSIRKGNETFDEILSCVPCVTGRIKSIEKPESGWVQIEDIDLCARFNPSWNAKRIYRKNMDENRRVKFVLGFRHEGIYAYAVVDDI